MNWDDVVKLEVTAKNDPTIRGKTVGMSFVEGYPANLYLLFVGGVTRPAVLKRNPSNPYDTNACEIWVNGSIVGHLPRDLAVEVAPRLDAGEDYTLETELLVHPEKRENPGLAFRLLFNEER